MELLMSIELKEIEKYCNRIRDEYEKYKNYEFECGDIDNFFSFPKEEYKLIEENIRLIEKYIKENDRTESIVKEYDKLLENINVFISKIGKSSYKNDIFCEIRDNSIRLFTFVLKTSLIISSITNIKTDSDNENLFDNNEQNNNKSKLGNFYSIYSKSDENDNNNFYENNGEKISTILKNSELSDFHGEINKNTKKIDIQKIKKKFEDIKNNYKFSKYYSNLLVKEEDFNKQSSADIEKCLPDKCKEFLLEFKKIRDELIIKNCKIENKLDFKYNFIIPNLNLESKKGGETYNPPEGWFGFGVKVKNEYKNDILFNKNIVNQRKANAYYSFNGMTPRKILRELNKIINKGFTQDMNNQPKCRCLDIRKKDMRVGTGIYLSPKIDFIESNTGMICFNNKTYKIALMVSVLADKIRQPDSNYWILRREEIEINKIILKEIHLDI